MLPFCENFRKVPSQHVGLHGAKSCPNHKYTVSPLLLIDANLKNSHYRPIGRPMTAYQLGEHSLWQLRSMHSILRQP